MCLADGEGAGVLRPSVLVVESDPAVRADVVAWLVANDFTVAAEAPGLAAMELAQSRRFDAMLLDIDLRGANDGVAVARWTMANHKGTRVILTATAFPLFPVGSPVAALMLLRRPYRLDDLMQLLPTEGRGA